MKVLVWNELAGGDGDYCAILVAFNSLLQMVLYAPFALFYIKVMAPSYAVVHTFEINYSIVAQSVAIFLGFPTPIKSNNRYPFGRSGGNSPGVIKDPRPSKLSTKIHRLDRAVIPCWTIIHHHHPLWLAGAKCCSTDCTCRSSRCSSHCIFRRHIPCHIIHLSAIQL